MEPTVTDADLVLGYLDPDYFLGGRIPLYRNLAEDAIRKDIAEPLGMGKDGPVYLKDIWPTNKEIADLVHATVTREAFLKKYADVFKGDEKWQGVQITEAETYDWPAQSTYIQNPPYFEGITMDPPPVGDVKGARILVVEDEASVRASISRLLKVGISSSGTRIFLREPTPVVGHDSPDDSPPFPSPDEPFTRAPQALSSPKRRPRSNRVPTWLDDWAPRDTRFRGSSAARLGTRLIAPARVGRTAQARAVATRRTSARRAPRASRRWGLAACSRSPRT